MRRRIILAFMFMLSLVTTSFAETSFKAEVDKLNISTDDVLTYKIIINSSDNLIPQPELPSFDGFGVVSRMQSSQLSFQQDGLRTIVIYTFLLLPSKIGKIDIGPATLKLKENTYTTHTFSIEVQAGMRKPQAIPQRKNPALPRKSIPKDQENQEPQYIL